MAAVQSSFKKKSKNKATFHIKDRAPKPNRNQLKTKKIFKFKRSAKSKKTTKERIERGPPKKKEIHEDTIKKASPVETKDSQPVPRRERKPVRKKSILEVKRRRLYQRKRVEGIQGPTKGALYIAHLPHGFYEPTLRSFFGQFGTITRLTVARSPRTANPMGYAFIEFIHEEVAHVVAKAMNGHLMYNKILKCEFIPHDRIPHTKFRKKQMTPENCPSTIKRIKNYKSLQAKRSEDKEDQRKLKIAKKMLDIQKRFPNLEVDRSVIQLAEESISKEDDDIEKESEHKEERNELNNRKSTRKTKKVPKSKMETKELEALKKKIEEGIKALR